MFSQVSFRARASAASPSRSRSAGSATSRRTFAVSSGTSSASSPVSPFTIDSGNPPTRSAALGVPQAAASVTVRHQPSALDAVSVTQARP